MLHHTHTHTHGGGENLFIVYLMKKRKRRLYLEVIMETNAYNFYGLHKGSSALEMGDIPSKSRNTKCKFTRYCLLKIKA